MRIAATALPGGKPLRVPTGFAHDCLTREGDCAVCYTMGENLVPEPAAGWRWSDPAFAIERPFAPAVISQRDAIWPDFVR
jgi:dTDP-4-dehydrorhamnose 3,5-epimerase